MRRIGVLTIYYKNYNYGGQLQAYALVDYIKRKGVYAEQISFSRIGGKTFILNKIMVWIKWPISKKIGFIRNHFTKYLNSSNKNESYKNTLKKFDDFMELIPHSKVYNKYDIENSVDEYNSFIVGSDQVWNVDYCTDEYFFSFLPENKKKSSYAASMNVLNISNRNIKRMKDYLKKFDYISVREEGAYELLKNKVGINNHRVVVDPVFLLSRYDWEKIANKVKKSEKYIFVYLIQREKCSRSKECIAYARRNGLKVICITSPGWETELSKAAKGLKSGIGPREFLGLISCAECVITDSFHATAFSIIFEKDFYVYGNDDRKETLLNKFDLNNRQIKDGDLNKKVSNLKIDYYDINEKMINYVENSKMFLEKIINY